MQYHLVISGLDLSSIL